MLRVKAHGLTHRFNDRTGCNGGTGHLVKVATVFLTFHRSSSKGETQVFKLGHPIGFASFDLVTQPRRFLWLVTRTPNTLPWRSIATIPESGRSSLRRQPRKDDTGPLCFLNVKGCHRLHKPEQGGFCNFKCAIQ